MRIDHVAIVTPNLMATAAQLKAIGLNSYDGGYAYVADGQVQRGGTAYRGVPLGNEQYIEVEQIIDWRPRAEADTDGARFLLELRDRADSDGPLMVGFWVTAEDFDEARGRVGGREQLHQRVRPDGVVCRELSCPPTMEAVQKGLPAFDQHLNPKHEHPSQVPIDHESAPVGIEWLEVGGTPDEMQSWLGPGAESLPLRYVGGAPGLRALGIGLEDGNVLEIRDGGQSLEMRV
jgi:hypothetical protein